MLFQLLFLLRFTDETTTVHTATRFFRLQATAVGTKSQFIAELYLVVTAKSPSDYKSKHAKVGKALPREKF